MTSQQPFQYQGSKRALALSILPYLPTKFRRLVEPFVRGGDVAGLRGAGRAEPWLNELRAELLLQGVEDDEAVRVCILVLDGAFDLRLHFDFAEKFELLPGGQRACLVGGEFFEQRIS